MEEKKIKVCLFLTKKEYASLLKASAMGYSLNKLQKPKIKDYVCYLATIQREIIDENNATK